MKLFERYRRERKWPRQGSTLSNPGRPDAVRTGRVRGAGRRTSRPRGPRDHAGRRRRHPRARRGRRAAGVSAARPVAVRVPGLRDAGRGHAGYAGRCVRRAARCDRHLRRSTRELYAMFARRYILPRLASRPLASITRLDVDRFVTALPADGGRCRDDQCGVPVAAPRSRSAEASGLVARNVARGVSAPKAPRQEMRFLSTDELHAVADAVGPIDRALVLLLGLCGLRIGEAAALTVDDVDFLAGVFGSRSPPPRSTGACSSCRRRRAKREPWPCRAW
jgi:hypothetical protein